ncbi:polymeric immunoglobulin receptor-like [Acipenser oxyrinchus oxyrinchus]|nr:polymeric immunoglobulin receptor-like [Acipenser oxyrinchus oxyrinchus]
MYKTSLVVLIIDCFYQPVCLNKKGLTLPLFLLALQCLIQDIVCHIYTVLCTTHFDTGAAALFGPDQVNGLLRESVTIQCRYGKDYKDNVKYWCKGQFRISCTTLISTDAPQTNDRISISDNKTEGVFTVTMRQLREEDEGWYWCGIKRTGYDEGISVYLTVNKGNQMSYYQVNGLLRESVTIQCRYGKHYKDNVKYWCKGQFCISCTTLIRTDALQTNDRISIRDNKTEGVFTVTMRQLREEDEGYYCCGIQRKPLTLDEVTSVYLTVNKGNQMSYCSDTRYS